MSILGVDWADALMLLVPVVAVAHLALQWVVHVVVYPGLADQALAAPGAAAGLHARYTSRMAVAVAPVYGLLIVAVVVAVASTPGWRTGAAAVAVAAALALTGLAAVPVHRELSAAVGADRVAALHRRLRRVDRARLFLALLVAVLLAAPP